MPFCMRPYPNPSSIMPGKILSPVTSHLFLCPQTPLRAPQVAIAVWGLNAQSGGLGQVSLTAYGRYAQ